MITDTGKADVECKRGKDSWAFIRYVFSFLIVGAIFLINTIPIIWYYKITIIPIVILYLAYLCFWNLRVQDKIFQFQNKIEWWRKIQ